MITTLDLNPTEKVPRDSADTATGSRKVEQFRTDIAPKSAIPRQLPQPLSEMRRCDTVNGVLIDIHRSLLQYASECSPLVSHKFRPRQQLLRRLISEQRKDVARLCGWLDERDWAVNFGTYPREFSGHNYIGLEQLWAMVISDQESLVSRMERIAAEMCADDETRVLLSDVLVSERRILEQLREPTKASTSESSTAA